MPTKNEVRSALGSTAHREHEMSDEVSRRNSRRLYEEKVAQWARLDNERAEVRWEVRTTIKALQDVVDPHEALALARKLKQLNIELARLDAAIPY